LPTSPEDDLDADLLSLVEKGLLQMSYDEARGDWVFWLASEGDALARNSIVEKLEKEADESSGND